MFSAAGLPQHLRPSGWLAMLPTRVETARLQGEVTADIAVIGSGFAGLAAARRLSQLDSKLRIALLEALAIGEGACGRNSGFIIDLPHEVSSESYSSDSASSSRREITMNRTAIALARGMAEEHGWGRDIFDPCGKYSVAMGAEGDHHLADYARKLEALGEAHKLLGTSEIVAITGSSAFTSGLYTPGCIIVQPAAYVRAFADALKPPVQLYERTPCLAFERRSAAWRIRTPKGAVSAGKIILANNGHAESFGFFRNRLLHIFTYASLTEEFDPGRLGGERNWAATPAHPMGTSVRRVRGVTGDRILIRSRYTYQPSLEITAGDIASAGRLHDRKFGARFPMLRDVSMQYRWGGAMALTWNAVPAFGELEPGLIAACACNGVGATKATASGIAAAEMALGQKSELSAIFAALPAPKPLPPQPFATIGVKASLALRHWRAGAE